MAKQPRIEQLSIYLLKPTILGWQNSLRQNAVYTQIGLPANAPGGAVLLARSTPPHPPGWLKYFPVATQQAAVGLLAASAGAVLFVSVANQWFAACFGTGWHLLAKDSFVRNFGLRAALSVIKDGTLKSVDVSTYENFAKHRRVSTSKGTTIESFDLEGSLDLLRGVFGECGLPVGVHIGGKDACVIWTRVQFDRLAKLCSTLHRVYVSKRVSRRYPILDNVAEVRDPAEIQRLDALLNAALAADPNHDVSIAPPEVVDWQNVQAFTLDHANAPAPSLQFAFADIRAMFAQSPTAAAMRVVEMGTQTPAGLAGPHAWTLYDCLVTEIDDNTNPTVKCILMAGDWYVVAATFVGQVNQDLLGIAQHATALPNALAGENEGQYNQRFQLTNPGSLTLLDKKNISYGGGNSRIEVCDVLSSAACLYHIKDYSGSATLSHLFSQGTVSARLLLEQDFRQKLLNKYPAIPANVFRVNLITPSAIEVTFGIICEATRVLPGGLPFFSKVRLLESARELKRMGFTNVSIAKITRP